MMKNMKISTRLILSYMLIVVLMVATSVVAIVMLGQVGKALQTFYDMEYLLKAPHKIRFKYNGKAHEVESVREGSECTVCFDGKWFHSRDEFYKDACIGKTKLTDIYNELNCFKVEE